MHFVYKKPRTHQSIIKMSYNGMNGQMGKHKSGRTGHKILQIHVKLNLKMFAKKLRRLHLYDDNFNFID